MEHKQENKECNKIKYQIFDAKLYVKNVTEFDNQLMFKILLLLLANRLLCFDTFYTKSIFSCMHE